MGSAPILILRGSRPAARATRIPLPPPVRADVATHEQLLAGRLAARIPRLDAVVIDAPTYREHDAAADVAVDVRTVRAADATCPVIVVVGDEAATVAVAAAGAGATDVLYASEVSADLAPHCLQALRMRRLRRQGGEFAATPAGRAPVSGRDGPLEMVGSSHAIGEVFQRIRRAAPFEVPVLLSGEPGTGKRLAALAIHDRSPRGEGPFVAVACGALSEALLDLQLFGRARATRGEPAPPSRLEAAAGGTIYLAEIGELPLLLQARLLRLLRERVLERTGGGRERVALDVRVLAGSSQDLAEAVRRGDLREDLLERLRPLAIELPPLRARDDDALLIARYFLARFTAGRNLPVRGFTRDADDAMLGYDWPGNVREVIARVRRAVLVSSRARATAEDLELAQAGGPGAMQTLREARREAEARSVRTALRRARGDLGAAARLLGIRRGELERLMGRLPPGAPQPRL